MKSVLFAMKPFSVAIILTLLVGGTVLLLKGMTIGWLFLALVVLEVTLSFDNAVVNSRVLRQLSPLWQRLFLTVGIIIEVFMVLLVLPVAIVALTSGASFAEVLQMATRQPERYAASLQTALPMINSFGGAFLLLVGLSYFIDGTKQSHWLKGIEKFLVKLAGIPAMPYLLLVVVVGGVSVSAPASLPLVLGAGGVALLLFGLLHSVPKLLHRPQRTESAAALSGTAALAGFFYLEVLDMSFSLDSVIGAFAITTDIWVIMAGLGIGALWIRSLTIHMVESDTLVRFRYIEHGAHWAVLALGALMLVKLYDVVVPEWLIGSIGLVLIGAAVATSLLSKPTKMTP